MAVGSTRGREALGLRNVVGPRRIVLATGERRDFTRIRPVPQSGADVPDDLGARLVALGIGHPFSKETNSPTEVDATIPAGASDHLVRTVTENCRTLRFTSQGFEKE